MVATKKRARKVSKKSTARKTTKKSKTAAQTKAVARKIIRPKVVGRRVMNARIYYTATGTIFAIVAVLHLFRVFFRWDVIVADGVFVVPLWFSWITVITLGYLALYSFFK